MGVPVPRAVVLTRPTDLELLVARHGTRAQARFFLERRGQALAEAEQAHEQFHAALGQVLAAIPTRWRRARLARAELDRFLFEPEDLLLAVGQDGLVANAAKYLTGQPVLGFNPMPERYDGQLVRLRPADAERALGQVASGAARLERRTMVMARLDDGQTLFALNEIFVGHRTHQSARYRLRAGDTRERHSSSGLIVATGTGCTGWARSIGRQRQDCPALPAPAEPALVFFVREAFPSRATGTGLTAGRLEAEQVLEVSSEMDEGGVVFGDGIEADRLGFEFGKTVRVGRAPGTLNLVAA